MLIAHIFAEVKNFLDIQPEFALSEKDIERDLDYGRT